MTNDRAAVDRVRQHYDKATVQLHSQSRQEREQGAAGPLKRFHNEIKRQLLFRFAKHAPQLLDLACGRGGDLHKWIGAQIAFVKGVDLSENEIWEARRRYQDIVLDRKDNRLKAKFEVSDSLGTQSYLDPHAPYDVVTCMFAIHYFFQSENTAKQFLHNVSQNLKPGGYFIGTVLSGKRIQNTIREGKTWPVYSAPMLSIRAQWGDIKPFGCAYSCAIGDTVTAGTEESEGSYEYLVFFNVLVTLAGTFGLVPVPDLGSQELDALFDEEDRKAPIKHFNPRFPAHSDPSLARASALNAAFVFRKQASGNSHAHHHHSHPHPHAAEQRAPHPHPHHTAHPHQHSPSPRPHPHGQLPPHPHAQLHQQLPPHTTRLAASATELSTAHKQQHISAPPPAEAHPPTGASQAPVHVAPAARGMEPLADQRAEKESAGAQSAPEGVEPNAAVQSKEAASLPPASTQVDESSAEPLAPQQLQEILQPSGNSDPNDNGLERPKRAREFERSDDEPPDSKTPRLGEAL